MKAPNSRIVNSRFAPLKRQNANAYPFTDATAIDNTTDGTRICTEFQKPRLKPSQFRPVQAVAHALIHGSIVTSRGNENTLPRRTSGIVFSEVTTSTYSGAR